MVGMDVEVVRDVGLFDLELLQLQEISSSQTLAYLTFFLSPTLVFLMVKKLPKASAMAAVQSEMHQLVSEQSDHPTHFGDDDEAHQEMAGEGAMGLLGAIPESGDHLQAQFLADRIGGVENQVKDLASQNLVILAQLQHLAQQVGGLVAASKPNRELMGEIPPCAMLGEIFD